ncbi:MAG: aldehyde dehydrogenase family protein [Alphaproteobacteria bacterium]|nr:aldehyde dehydrogenase family protein [Alphaproteobacteria bacterium]
MTRISDLLKKFDLTGDKGDLNVFSPIDGSLIGELQMHTSEDVDKAIKKADAAFDIWKKTPPPVRGELVRLLGEELRSAKADLGALVTVECGKIASEGLGEVQEMIDICDFAVGLSRQLYGLTIASERPGHHMREVWHPAGTVAVISAFNFPVAVWSWNAAIAFVCGDPVIWKPSEKTPLTALACKVVFERALKRFRDAGHDAPEGLLSVLIGEKDIGQTLVNDERVPLVSATGSVPMGRAVAQDVAKRLGRSLLELGGNNAMIVTPAADLDMAMRAILFSAVGTAGQRCTSLRRLIVHQDVADGLLEKLKKAYGSLRIGDPLDKNTLVGPLIDDVACKAMEKSVETAKSEGGELVCGGARAKGDMPKGGHYMEPAIIRMSEQKEIVCHETFAPILYVMTYSDLEDAIRMNNAVPQGLSSCIFTTDIREAELFLSSGGSDCGIANVNIGPSGAEIGGAFGGEKETGGGRESGSDSWKFYMRRQTQTINYSRELPLAQGVKFDV